MKSMVHLGYHQQEKIFSCGKELGIKKPVTSKLIENELLSSKFVKEKVNK